jgi:hypothetical protein
VRPAAPAGAVSNISESTSHKAAKLAMMVAAAVSRSAKAEAATVICRTKAGRTTSATARRSAAGGICVCSPDSMQLAIATVK